MKYSKTDQLSKNKDKGLDELDLSIVMRYPKPEVKKRVEFILQKEVCQVCETSHDLDFPHHSRYGISRKDDRFLICICVDCHRIIHNQGFSKLKKTREQTEDIAWQNHLEYLNAVQN